MSDKSVAKNYTNLQTFLLVALRILLGWYFLYEGIVKIANPDWSSFNYLMDSLPACITQWLLMSILWL